MVLHSTSDRIKLDSYVLNGEWEMIGSSAEHKEFSFEDDPSLKYRNCHFTIHIQRRPAFYMMNVIMPSILTSILMLSIFFCSPAQKVQIGVVCLLSFRIFLLNLS